MPLLCACLSAQATAAQSIQLTGSLVDSSGEPVELPLLIAEEGAVSTDGSDVANAPPSSRFAAELPPGRYVVEVALPSGALLRQPLGALVQDKTFEPWSLPQIVTRTLSVTDPAGDPIDGAVIHAVSTWGGRLEAPQPFRRGPRRRILEQTATYRASTRSDGRAQIQLPETARHRLVILAKGFAAQLIEFEKAAPVQVTLQPPVFRSLEVIDPRGQPAADAEVRLAGVVLARTNEQGLAVLAAGAQDLLLEVEAESGGAALRLDPSSGKSAEPFTIRLDAPGELDGEVTDAQTGKPLANVVVWPEENPESWQRTDEVGRFTLEAEPSRQGYTLRAAAAGYEAGELRTAGRGASVHLALQPSHSLTVRVLSPSEEPVAGADVAVQPHNPWRMGFPWTTVTTDGRGVALLRDLSQGAFDVRARHPDFGEATERFWVGNDISDRQVTLRLQEGVRGVGRVTDLEGQPIEGVAVMLSALPQAPQRRYLWLDDHVVASAATDSEGRFALPTAAAGRYDLFLQAEPFAPRRNSAVDLADGKEDLGTFTMTEGLRIDGRLLTAEGEPIGKATLRVDRPWLPDVNVLFDEGDVPVAPDGRFAATGLGPGEHGLYVKAEGFIPLSTRVELPSEEPLELTLERGFSVRGRVEDAAGRPLSATVALLRGKHQVTKAQTAGDGTYELEAAQLGTEYQIAVAAEGFQSVTVELEETERVHIIERDVVLDTGRTLTGRLLDEQGLPVASARIGLSRIPHDGEAGLRRPLQSDARGGFSASGLSDQPYRLSVQADSFVSLEKEVDAATEHVELTLTRGLSIRGVVLDEDGEPVEGARWIASHSLDLAAWGSSTGPRQLPTDSAGRFEILGLEPGFYRIRIDKEGYAKAESDPVELTDRSIEGLEIRLTRGHTVEGEVTGLDVGELSQVQVSALELEGGALTHFRHRQVAVATDGTFSLSNVRAGIWKLRATLEADGGPRSVERRIDVRGFTHDVELAFADTVEIRGRVLLDGEPASGASVSVAGAQGDAVSTADELGQFELTAPAGTVELSVRAGGARHLERFDLVGDLDLEIALESTVLTVLVEDAEGQPVGRAALSVLDSQGHKKRVGGTGPDGLAELRLDKPDSGALQLMAWHHEMGVGRTTIQGGQVSAVVVLEASTTAPLRLLAPDGRELRHGQVWLEANGFVVAQFSARGGRAFEVSAPPGRYRLWAEGWGAAAGPRLIELPADEIVIPLQPAGFVMLRGRRGAGLKVSGRLQGQRHPDANPIGLEGRRSRPLAPGRWTIEVHDLIDGTTREIAVDVMAGETTEIELP